MSNTRQTLIKSLNSSNGRTSNKSTNIKAQQFDNGIRLFFYVSKDGFVEPINGATVHLKFMNKINNTVLNRVCEITDAELGECLYTLTKDDLSIVGTYNTEVQVDYANGTILSLDNAFTLTVTPETIPWMDI